MTDQPTKAPRTTHTPAEKATEAVAVLRRRLAKLKKSKAAFELQALELEPQIESMNNRLNYALSNPDLPVEAQLPAPLPVEAQLAAQAAGETPTA
jgi:phage shock protein A